jgi:hypothetical protein
MTLSAPVALSGVAMRAPQPSLLALASGLRRAYGLTRDVPRARDSRAVGVARRGAGSNMVSCFATLSHAPEYQPT